MEKISYNGHGQCDRLTADSTIICKNDTVETYNPFAVKVFKFENGVNPSSNEVDNEKLSTVMTNLSLIENQSSIDFTTEMTGNRYPTLTKDDKGTETFATFDNYINGLPQIRNVSRLQLLCNNKENSIASCKTTSSEETDQKVNGHRDSVRPKETYPKTPAVRRAISETRSPVEHVRMTRQLLEMNKQSVLRESDLYENEKFHLNIIEENLTKIDYANIKSGSCKNRTLGKLKRSKTSNDFDGIKTNKAKGNFRFSKSIDETSSDLFVEDDRFEKPSSKPISKRKQLKRTISMRFTRLKELSLMSSSRSHRKLRNEFFLHEDSCIGHETSRRKIYHLDTEDLALIGQKNKSKDNTMRTRSMSVPSMDTPDEDLDDLYLPRRMAICPNLSVPAMKQLKTYLILTRLKQYCFV